MVAVPKPTRIKDRKLLDRSHSATCVVCGRQGCDPAHGKTRGSGGDDVAENVFDFCREHHTEQGNIGWKRFSEKYPTAWFSMIRKGWKIDERGRLVRAAP